MVKDTNKVEGVEDVIIKIANLGDTSIHKGLLTDIAGECTFVNIPTGIYRLKGYDIQYGDIVVDNINIHNDTTIIIPVGRDCIYDKQKKNRVCPKCKKANKVIPIAYGLVIRTKKGSKPLNNRKSKTYYAGCIITHCDPNWYCKRDKTKF